MADKEGTIKLNSEEIRESKQRALEYLNSHYFYAASDAYDQILKNNPNDIDARLGLLMCANKVDNEEKLIRYYQDLFARDDYEIKLACEKETDHIEEMCEKFCLPDYLEKEEIRKIYDYDLSYKSNVFSRRKQRDEIQKEINNNEHLTWLKDKGFKEFFDIVGVYDRRLEEAEGEEQENIRRIKSEYQRFLYNAYTNVKDLYGKAKEKKEADYRNLVDRFDHVNEIEELRELSFEFSRFKEYKDGKRYIDLCNKKIDDIRQLEKEKTFKKNIDNTMNAAKAALVTGKYSDAYNGFSEAIAALPDNEEAYLGLLMAKSKVSDLNELFDHYKRLYDDEEYETLEACKEDSDHIEEMADKYYLPDYLDKETIREKYSFDRTYRSCLNARIVQEKQFKEEVELDPVFGWLKKNGSDKIRRKIDDVYDYYALRIKEAKEEDHRQIERIKSDYQRFLFKTYSTVKDLNKRASKKQEESYKQLVRSYELANSQEELEELIHKLELFGDYKESEKYVSLCHKKIQQVEEKEKEGFISQDIETTLIAGQAYLASGNAELADHNFQRVLEMDPDNQRAYLGILMIETCSKNIDELVKYYQDLYRQDEIKILSGCKEDTAHIDEMTKKCTIPGYLEEDTIRKYYAFDRSFESLTDSRVEQRDQFNDEVKMNPLFGKITSGNDKEILSFLDRVRGEYEARIVEAKTADERQRESIRHIYEIYLAESDKTVLRIYEEKLKEKSDDDENNYQRNVEQFEKDLSEEELLELTDRFNSNYKDGSVYIEKCKERINQLRRDREKEKLDTLLINGTALLESGLYPQAKDRFESYLDIDPESEEVHLKLLMAEKKVPDIDALFDYYNGLYADEVFESKEAVEENSGHIDEMCERCYIPGLLEKEEIRKRYEFNRYYDSLVNTRESQKKQIEDELELDPLLSWLKENGSPVTLSHIDRLLETYDQRLEEAMDEDAYLAKTIEKEYRSFIRNTDREVRTLFNDLNRERNRRLKESEKERKEKERQLKEEAGKQRLLELEEIRRQKELEEDALRKQREEAEALRREEEQRQETLRIEKEAREKTAREIEKEERLKSEKLLKEADRNREYEIREERLRRQALEEKEKLEEQARKRAERERKEEEKRRLAEEKKLLKEENKKKEKGTSFGTLPAKERQPFPFKLNFGLVAAALSLILLGALIYIYVVVPGNKYKNAVSVAESGNYDEAIAIFMELDDYKDAQYKVKETTYRKADSLYKQDQKVEAANIFDDLRFDDSEDRVDQIKNEMREDADIGDTILFGDYEQDGNTENGKELIEWIVLDKQEGAILVISKDAIESQKFNSDSQEVYWENSTLRSWLNGRFPDNAFSREKPSDVLQTSLTNLRYELGEEEIDIDELIPEEYETLDRIFLLSSEEVEVYYPEESSRICKASEYAIENGVAANADNSCNWWLRDCSMQKNNTSYIVKGSDGALEDSMYEITNAIRPAMWLKQEN